MATTVQVTVDCADPHRVAQFWAEALGYVKESHVDVVRGLLDAGLFGADDTVEVDGGVQFAEVSACRDPDGVGPRLFFQRVPEGRSVKNRLHLDLHVGPDRAEAEAERLVALVATHLWHTDDRGTPCWTMADVEGNEFCVE